MEHVANVSGNADVAVEQHPLQPFLPRNGRVLMLGSFPPPRKRWSMDFFYPNFQNDMWRIIGHIFYADRNRFVDAPNRRFKYAELVEFLYNKGIALYDSASAVRRLQGNASDKFLEIVTPTEICDLLDEMPDCRAIVATGEKSAEQIGQYFSVVPPRVGTFTEVSANGRTLFFYRMPSTSRAYPLPLEKKAAAYAEVFKRIGMIS